MVTLQPSSGMPMIAGIRGLSRIVQARGHVLALVDRELRVLAVQPAYRPSTSPSRGLSCRLLPDSRTSTVLISISASRQMTRSDDSGAMP